MNRADTIRADRVNWAAVGAYYLLACALSWPFFWWRWAWPESWRAWDPAVPKTLTYMWGPGLAAIVALIFLRRSHRRTVTFVGSSAWRSLAFWFVPVLALCAVYGADLAGQGRLVVIPWMIVIGFVTILGEELGWRGFLQDALRPLSRVRRYVLIGLLWELWHFTARWGDGRIAPVIARVALMAVLTILMSWLFGEVVDRTRSLIPAVTLHFWVNMLFEAEEAFKVPPARAYLVAAASVLFWIALVRTWPRPGPLSSDTPRRHIVM